MPDYLRNTSWFSLKEKYFEAIKIYNGLQARFGDTGCSLPVPLDLFLIHKFAKFIMSISINRLGKVLLFRISYLEYNFVENIALKYLFLYFYINYKEVFKLHTSECHKGHPQCVPDSQNSRIYLINVAYFCTSKCC